MEKRPRYSPIPEVSSSRLRTGHCSVVILAVKFTRFVQRYMNWNEKSKGAIILKKICGVLVLFGGLYLIFIAG